MSADRTTVWHISGGQARPYGPTVNTTRVYFEHAPMWSPGSYDIDQIANISAGNWISWDLVEERVRERLLGLKCGFTEFTLPKDRAPTESEHFTTRLVYLKKLAPGIWEFQTMHPYTD